MTASRADDRLGSRVTHASEQSFRARPSRLVGQRGVVLRQVRNEIGDDAGLRDDVMAEQFDAAGVGPQQPDELPHQARLARAIGAEQPEDLAAADLEVRRRRSR